MFWEFNYSELAHGNHDFISACLEHLKEFKQLCTFFGKYNQDSLPDFKEVADFIETYDLNDTSGHHTISQFSELLELIKTAVLTERHQEQFMEEALGEVPY
ncbi:hypothetical protein GALL_538740 [mine drainage metagenome]|uniref:Uncharacterized protein n=1 Tax=mine drainage metagenome TaxID=410659 RepID=A0A1J5P9T8_9ZZZZ